MRYWDIEHDRDENAAPTNAALVEQDAADEAAIEKELEDRPWRQCEECEDLTQHDTEFTDMCSQCQTSYGAEESTAALERGFRDMQGSN